MNLTVCAKCGSPLAQPSTGRPRRFCSTGCKRAVEYEVRRIQRQLDAVEAELIELGGPGCRFLPAAVQDRIAHAEGVRRRLEARLALLLDDGEVPPPPADVRPVHVASPMGKGVGGDASVPSRQVPPWGDDAA